MLKILSLGYERKGLQEKVHDVIPINLKHCMIELHTKYYEVKG